jgi:hypothetical protein
MAKAAHHRGSHQRHAAKVVAAANADPTTRCQAILPNGKVCNRTLTQHPPTKTGKPPEWTAGHINHGQVATSTADYRPEVMSCNSREGATRGNRNREFTTSRDW